MVFIVMLLIASVPNAFFAHRLFYQNDNAGPILRSMHIEKLMNFFKIFYINYFRK